MSDQINDNKLVNDNKLAEALELAAKEPAKRGDFYNELMQAKVFVAGRFEGQEPGEPNDERHFQVKQWPHPDGGVVMPFFESLEMLRKTLSDEEEFVEIPAPELFKRTQGATLIFTTEKGQKEFKPNEIASLLSQATMWEDRLAPILEILAKNKEDSSNKTLFYNTLVNSMVFVIGSPSEESKKGNGVEQQAAAGKVSLAMFDFTGIDKPALPFFSSLEILKKNAPPEADFMAFQAVDFLKMAQDMGCPLVLNPGAELNKVFEPDEVASLLEATKPNSVEAREIKAGSKVSLGPPAAYPEELAKALSEFLAAYPAVSAAYVAMMSAEDNDGRPGLMFGFEGEGDMMPMFQAAGELVNEFAPKGLTVDFAKIEPGTNGISQYFLEESKPFYRRPASAETVTSVTPFENVTPETEAAADSGLLKKLKGFLKKTTN